MSAPWGLTSLWIQQAPLSEFQVHWHSCSTSPGPVRLRRHCVSLPLPQGHTGNRTPTHLGCGFLPHTLASHAAVVRSMWHWGSLAKSLTATVFARLVAEGHLPSLDVPLVGVLGIGREGPYATATFRQALQVCCSTSRFGPRVEGPAGSACGCIGLLRLDLASAPAAWQQETSNVVRHHDGMAGAVPQPEGCAAGATCRGSPCAPLCCAPATLDPRQLPAPPPPCWQHRAGFPRELSEEDAARMTGGMLPRHNPTDAAATVGWEKRGGSRGDVWGDSALAEPGGERCAVVCTCVAASLGRCGGGAWAPGRPLGAGHRGPWAGAGARTRRPLAVFQLGVRGPGCRGGGVAG